MVWDEAEDARVREFVAHAANDSDSDRIASFLLLMAVDALDAREEDDLVFNEDRLGYLQGVVTDRTMLVPFNLVPGLASKNLLQEMLAVGELVSAAQASRLCLSGSSAFLGNYKVIADIDFCEYAVITPPDLASRVSELVNRDTAPYLVEVKINDERLIYPWNSCLAEAGRMLSCLSDVTVAPDKPAHSAKLDFVDGSTGLGNLPVTNVVLPIFEGPSPGTNTGRSFPFQEVIFLRGPVDAPDLAAAGRLSAYVAFLRDQIAEKINSDPIKALKRAVSLFRLLGIKAMTEKAVEMINDDVAANIVKRARAEEFSKYLQYAGPMAKDWISKVSQVDPGDPMAEQAAKAAVAAYVSHMKSVIDELFSPYEQQSLAS